MEPTGNARRRPAGRLGSATLRASGGDCGAEGIAGTADRPARTARDEAGYERWLARQTERLDPLMAFLGIVFTLLVAFELSSPDLSPGWARGMTITLWVLWGAFVVDFAAKVLAAPSAVRFLRRHWLSVAMLLVPTLRLLRFGVLLRVGRALPAARVISSSYRATGVARQLLRSRTSFIGAVVVVSTLACAQLAWLAERGRGTFATFGDALLWAATTVIGAQGDPVPETALGQIVMLVGFAVGLVLLAALAGTVGAYLLEEREERAGAHG
jgi:voltage-gated potassium channel